MTILDEPLVGIARYHLAQRPDRSQHQSTSRVIKALSYARGCSFDEAAQLLFEGDANGVRTLRDLCAHHQLDVSAVEQDLQTLSTADDIRRAVNTKVGPAIRPAGRRDERARIDAETFEKVMTAPPMNSRLFEARQLDPGRFEKDQGAEAWQSIDRELATAGIDAIATMRQAAEEQHALSAAQGVLRPLSQLELGRTPDERRQLLDQAVPRVRQLLEEALAEGAGRMLL